MHGKNLDPLHEVNALRFFFEEFDVHLDDQNFTARKEIQIYVFLCNILAPSKVSLE